MRTLALRPHLVWGHGDPHLLPRVISKHRAGKLKIVGDGKNRVDLTHLDNVVHAHLCALRSMVSDRQLGGKAYFVGQGEPVLLWDWLNEIFSELGLPRLEKISLLWNRLSSGPFDRGHLGIIFFGRRPPHDPLCCHSAST